MPRTPSTSDGRGLRIYNAVGVVLLFVVCMVQWHSIHERDARLHEMESVRKQLSSALAGATNTLAQSQVQLSALEALNETHAQRATQAESQVKVLERQSLECTSAQARLQDQVIAWKQGVSDRDQRLQVLTEQVAALVTERDTSIRRYNELVRQHNEVVSLLEKTRSQLGANPAAR